MTRTGKMARGFGAPGPQITLPCRYCGADTEMSKDLIENLLRLSAATIERRGEKPIQRDEIAVCAACVPRYDAQFCPRTVVVDVPRETGSDEQDDSPDGFGPPDKHQEAMSF